ncbi:hypothetical protein QBC47DRAFT_291706 [Echria macrotheca]|uniref:MARVEL domain-containing protein n=1 Tax=Echria macrotheca TaxID=438768 RepID=A0AAJ0BQ50_9PEZI|nr:hypothetical protein QBC47DRAFT_291706 [Echria macrotheca]
MDSTGSKSSLSNIIPRSLLGLSNFSVLASSAIVTGIISWFLHRWPGYRNTHLIYQEVIAVLTLLIYLFALALPAFKGYRGYGLPLTLALSYLWLTSLIFASQDWSGHRCYYSQPVYDYCRMKHAVQAFQIIGFCSLLFNTVIEAIMWAEHRRHQAKARTGTVTTVVDKCPVGTCTHTVPGTHIPTATNGDRLV